MPVIMFSHCSQGRGYNTGVTLMNLAAMKRRKWAKLWRSVAKTYLPKAGPTKLADQVCERHCFMSGEYDNGGTDFHVFQLYLQFTDMQIYFAVKHMLRSLEQLASANKIQEL